MLGVQTKKIRLKATEWRLLQRVYRDGYCCTCLVSGHGPEGGRVANQSGNPVGSRESGAACHLRDKGLLVLIATDDSSSTRSGWTTRYHAATWRPTPEGKRIAEQVTKLGPWQPRAVFEVTTVRPSPSA